MSRMVMPSVQLDVVYEDFLDATQGELLGTEEENFDVDTGGDFTVAIDGGAPETINLTETQLDFPNDATAAAVAAAITDQITGGEAFADSGKVGVRSLTYGVGSSVQIANGTLDVVTLFGWDTSLHSGSDYTSQLVLINRNPAPSEAGVPLDNAIEFDLLASSGTTPSTSTTSVYVKPDAGEPTEILAYQNGTFYNGYTGTASVPETGVLRFSIVSPEPFLSATLTAVRVVYTGTPAFDETYVFTALDDDAPLVADVTARGVKLLRITFVEPVTMDSIYGSDDALNPANYLFEHIYQASVSVEAVSVTRVDDVTVDLVTDIELTFGAPYMLVVQNITDAEGNVFVAPYNTFNFTAYAPEYPAGRRWRIDEWIPAVNRGEDVTDELRGMLAIIQEVANLLLYEVDKWVDIIDLDRAPEAFLDAMLADLGNPFEFELSEIDKRRLLRILVDIYQAKGTGAGIVNAIRFFLGIETWIEIFTGDGWILSSSLAPQTGNQLSSWREIAPNPGRLSPGQRGLYSFRIHADNDVLTDEERERITEIAEYMKPAHTHLVEIIDASPAAVIDHVELGLSQLGTDDPDGDLGLFRLH